MNVSKRHTQSNCSIKDKKSTSDNFEYKLSTLYETIFKEFKTFKFLQLSNGNELRMFESKCVY